MMYSNDHRAIGGFSRTISYLLALGAVMLTGCGIAAQSDDDDGVVEGPTSSSSEAIINGVDVSAQYPEVAELIMTGGTLPVPYACTGVLISPMVVLTAGHCVTGPTTWEVTVGGTTLTTTSKWVYDWTDATGVNPLQHDNALLFLSNPIWIQTYPTLAQTPAASNAQVMNVGRIHNGITNSAWGAVTSTLNDGAQLGGAPPYSGTYAFDYWTNDVIEHGDSGGPDFLLNTHQIISVNSAIGPNIELLARVDLLAGVIGQQIDGHPAPTFTNAQISCVFDWAENHYPTLFAPAAPGVLLSSPPYLYRYFSATNSYLGAAQSGNSHSTNVYFMGSDGVIQDEGSLGYWMNLANCH